MRKVIHLLRIATLFVRIKPRFLNFYVFILSQDMYEKMIQIDSNAPTEEEHRLKGVTKPR